MTLNRSLTACWFLFASRAFAQLVVPWASETVSIPSTVAGDPTTLSRTFVLEDGGLAIQTAIVGTDTVQNGAYVFNLDGTVAQLLPLGPVNAVDARDDVLFVTNPNVGLQAFVLGDGGFQQLAPVSFNVPSPGPIAARPVDADTTELWVDTRSTTLRRFTVHRDGGALTWTAQPSVTLPQASSGLAVDPRTGQLYVAQPSRGILQLDPDGQGRFVVAIDAGQLGAVVGGLDLLPLLDGGAWLFSAVASRDRVAVYEVDALNGSTLVGTFEVGAPDGGAARARLPAHLDLYTQPIPGFPRGLLTLHDGVVANYKIVNLVDVDAVLPFPPTWPADGGAAADAGASDAGTGTTDGGVRDGGTIGGGGGGPRPPVGSDPEPKGCGCTSPSILILPLLLLWWIRRSRS
jgi:myo-inositol-hexaphosphate 3-phosphohydrolase